MTDLERKEVLANRKSKRHPWHQPPHFIQEGLRNYLITSSCYEHAPIVGVKDERLAQCEAELLGVCKPFSDAIHAWCVLPNHYHLLVLTEKIRELLSEMGRWHGRTSRRWNQEDDAVGRKVWFNTVERVMRSERHFLATLNYVHHNPVKHGYVKRWQDWPFGSASQFLEEHGREKVAALWAEYPVLDYGAEWDP